MFPMLTYVVRPLIEQFNSGSIYHLAWDQKIDMDRQLFAHAESGVRIREIQHLELWFICYILCISKAHLISRFE